MHVSCATTPHKYINNKDAVVVAASPKKVRRKDVFFEPGSRLSKSKNPNSHPDHDLDVLASSRKARL